jgi:hypothetical protein
MLCKHVNNRIIGGKTAIDANEFAEHVLGFEDTTTAANDSGATAQAY